MAWKGLSSGVLIKRLLFRELEKSGPISCYRCGKPIAVDDFTIDHKNRHEGDPSVWWDLDNIAYSHYSCNAAHNGASEKRWITNGIDSKMLAKHKPLPEGWREGRVQNKDSSGKFMKVI